jgi:hypothetical protein
MKSINFFSAILLVLLFNNDSSAQNFPFGKYYLVPKTGGTWKIWEVEFKKDLYASRFRDSTLSTAAFELETVYTIDTILHIKDKYHFITRGKSDPPRFTYFTVKENKNKTEFKSPIVWQANGLNKQFFFVETLIDYLSNDTLPELYIPLYSAADAKKFHLMKSLGDMTEKDMLSILNQINRRLMLGNNIYSALSDSVKQTYNVHRFYKLSMYGSAFFEAGYRPFVTEENARGWRHKFSANNEIVQLLDKLF